MEYTVISLLTRTMSVQEKSSQPTPNGPKSLHPSLRDLKLGVWRVVWEPGPAINLSLHRMAIQDFFKSLRSDLDTLLPFLKEVYTTVGSWLLITYFVSDLWSGFGSTALLVFSNKVLKAVCSETVPSLRFSPKYPHSPD